MNCARSLANHSLACCRRCARASVHFHVRRACGDGGRRSGRREHLGTRQLLLAQERLEVLRLDVVNHGVVVSVGRGVTGLIVLLRSVMDWTEIVDEDEDEDGEEGVR